MPLRAIHRGKDGADSAAFVLLPPSRVDDWTHASTGFSWAEHVHSHLASNAVFAFEHADASVTGVLASCRGFIRELVNLQTSEASLQNRPWILVGQGLGGVIAKRLIAETNIATNSAVGLVLLDTPNLDSLDTDQDLAAVMNELGCPPPVSNEDRESMKELRHSEQRFIRAASRLVVLVNGFTLESKLSRRNVRLDISNEDQFCFRIPAGTLCIFRDEKDEEFRAFTRLLRRAADSVCTHKIVGPMRASSKNFDTRMMGLLRKHFPLKRDYDSSLHMIEFFSNTASDGSPGIRTEVRSRLVPTQDVVKRLALRETHDDSCMNQKISFQWCHSPANHHAWVEFAMEGILESSSLATNMFSNLWHHTFQSAKGLRLGSWHIRAACAFMGPEGIQFKTKSEGLILILPFIHWDTAEYLKEREEAINILNSDKLPPALRSSYAKAGTDPTTKLHSASVMGDSPLHLPQLLDQYKYPMVSMPADRISKQILPKLTEKSGAGSRSLTVQQLWLIVPGNGTILTYFPPKEPNNDGTNVAQVGDVENAILNCVADIRHPSDVCLDVYDLAALITHTTTTNLLGRTKHPDFQFINLYRAAVGELRRKHLASLTSFKDEDLQKTKYDVEQDSKEENYELSLIVEAHALKDELQILVEIISAQVEVVRRLKVGLSGDGEEEAPSSTADYLLIKTVEELGSFEADFQALRTDAESIERDLLRLLDLRQKRANLREAHAAWLQARETSVQTEHSLSLSKSAARQSRVVLIFTLLTSVYLPLSFFSSYYGMNLKDITGDSGNPGTTRDYWIVAGPTTVGVTLIAIAMGFNHTLIAKLKQASFAFGRKQQKKSTAPSLPGP